VSKLKQKLEESCLATEREFVSKLKQKLEESCLATEREFVSKLKEQLEESCLATEREFVSKIKAVIESHGVKPWCQMNHIMLNLTWKLFKARFDSTYFYSKLTFA
jgi:hypothetical protein